MLGMEVIDAADRQDGARQPFPCADVRVQIPGRHDRHQRRMDYVLPEDLEWVAKEIAKLMADPSWDKTATIRSRTEDGRIIWVTGMGTPFEYEGKPAMLISLVDVTAAKEAELKLQESEEKNRLLVDNATEGIAVVQDGILKFTNPKFAESVGYPAQELVDRSFADFIHPDDRQRVAEYYFKRLSGEEAPSSYQFKWVDRGAAVHWGEASVVSLRWEGRPATLCMLSDITERVRAQEQLKESEERYRLLAENASDIIWVVDVNLKITYVSPSTTPCWDTASKRLWPSPSTSCSLPVRWR